MKCVKNDLFDYEERYIYQLEEGFKFSLDSLLLAEYVKIPSSTNKILDLCTGNAPIPLVLSKYTDCLIYGFEIQKEIFDLAVMSVKENRLDKQITIYHDDICNIDKYFDKATFDIITCNPPYFKYHDDKSLNDNEIKTIARHEVKIDLDKIFRIAKDYLNDNGIFYLVHRSNRLDEIMMMAEKYKLRIKEMQLIKTKDVPNIVLVKCYKQANYGVKINDVIDVRNLKTYKNLFKKEV